MIDVSMKSLREKLRVNSDLLERVARLWSVSDLSSPSALKLIEERMHDPCAARSVWEHLSPPERACLFQVVDASARRKGIQASRVMKKAKLASSEGSVIVTQLIEEWGLIEEDEVLPNPTAVNPQPIPVRMLYAFRECGETLERTGAELFKSYADRASLSLSRLLGQFDWGDLEKLASLCHISTSPARISYASSAWSSESSPADLRTRIAEAFTRSPIAIELLTRLEPLTQRLYVWLCTEQRGKARMEAVRTELRGTEEDLFAVLHQLEAHALAFDTLTTSAERWLCVPQELFAILEHEVRERAADDQTFALFPIETEPSTIREGQPTICYDLATVIGYIHQHDVEPTKDGKLPKRISGKLRPLLHGKPRLRELEGETYVDQVFQLAEALGLLMCAARASSEKPRYQPGANLPAWEKRDLVDQVRLVLSEWKKSTTWYDVLLDGGLIYPSAYNLGAVRKTLFHHLLTCLPGHWYRLEALLYRIWKEQPIPLPFSHAVSRYDLQPSGPSSLRTLREQWMQRGEGPLYTGLLASALAEMGLVSLGYTGEPEASSVPPRPAEWFQLTTFGAIVLSDGQAKKDSMTGLWFVPEERPLIVQPSFELLLLQPSMPVLYQLIHWAEIKRIGPVSTLTLTQKALLRGMAAGSSVQQVTNFLAQQSRKELAQNVVYTLNDWSRAYKGATLAEVVLVDASSEQVALDLVHLLKENHIEVRPLTSCTLAIFLARGSLLTVRHLLEKAGVFVREDIRTTADRSNW